MSLLSQAIWARVSSADRTAKSRKQDEYLKQLWIFFGSIATFLILLRVLSLIGVAIRYLKRPSYQLPIPPSEKGGQVPRRRNWICRLANSVTTTTRILLFRVTVPIGTSAVCSISELAIVAGYLAAVFTWLLIDTKDLQTFFWEDRAALFATTQLPLIIVLSSKNNIVSFLTGISHEKLNVFHRTAGRTVFVLLWMHFLARALPRPSPAVAHPHGYIIAGIVSLAGITALVILSLRVVRHNAFEFFFVSHIVVALVCLIGAYYHLRDLKLDIYIWPALIVWAFDRILRLARVFWNNRIWGTGYHMADVKLVSSDTISLTMKRKLRWKPGQHAYVILPTVSRLMTEAHPFTIASIPSGKDENDVVFIVRARTGFTLRLKELAATNNSETISVPALIDGPYGNPPSLHTFTTCVLLAGGSGVSYILPLLQDIISRAKSGKSLTTRRVKFVWIVRHKDALNWISKTLEDAISGLPPSLDADVDVYVTGSRPQPSGKPEITPSNQSASSSASIRSEQSISEISSVTSNGMKILSGRPDIRKILNDEITLSSGPVSVDVSGPSSLTNGVRTTLRSGVAGPSSGMKDLPPVELHVETFGMVKG